MLHRLRRLCAVAVVIGLSPLSAAAGEAVLPDGRVVTPEGFTTPLESFVSGLALSPDGRYLAALSQDGGAIDVVDIAERAGLVDRLPVPSASGLLWNADGLFVTRGYTGTIARFGYSATSKQAPKFTQRGDLHVDTMGLLNGIAEDPATHRIAVARTADREVVTLDDATGKILARRKTRGEPFAVAFAGETIVATLYNSDRIVAWRDGAAEGTEVVTGPHPTQLLVGKGGIFVANADGHDVALVDPKTLAVTRHYDLGIGTNPPPGQTPSGMALSADANTLYVAESGFNDVAAVDVGSGRVATRIPTGWYPTAVVERSSATSAKDTRSKEQLFIASAKGFGSQPDPGGEWNGTYTGIVQHVVVEPNRFAEWSARVARNDRFEIANRTTAPALPPIKHVVFILHENKHFDEEFGDEPRAQADPALLVYGRRFTPNAHALADRYTLFDNFMSNGEASILGHASATQGMVNDYHERNAHSQDESGAGIASRVAWSIWPYPESGEDVIGQATMDFDWFRDLTDLPGPPRVNVSGVFGPRGELIDELHRKHVSFRVYGEQMTMEPDGRIAAGLAASAVRAYPGAHIDFDVSDSVRAQIFLDDVTAHGLPQYAYLTLPTDHTAGTKPGFYTPASFVASNDFALAQIVAGLSKLPDWRDTVIFVTCDDAQGTGDHVDSHRMPALAIGPYVRRGFIDHTRYSIPSILRTVEVLYGLAPLNIFDAAATPLYDAFARQPVDDAFATLAETIPMTRNPGKAVSFVEPLDGPDDVEIAREEWTSVRGPRASENARASIFQASAQFDGLTPYSDRTAAR